MNATGTRVRRALKFVWAAMLLACVSSPSGLSGQAGGATCASLPPGAIGCWSGDGAPTDSTGINNGALQGGVTFAPGLFGQAFSFDGTSGSVLVPDSPSLDVTTQFTLAAWINPTGLMQDPAQGGIISKVGGAGGNNGFQFVMTANGACLRLIELWSRLNFRIVRC